MTYARPSARFPLRARRISPRAAMLVLFASLATPGTAAFAQSSDTLLVPPTVPPDYSRGRNVSVLEKSRAEYDPLGIRAGGFVFYPKADVAVGATSNVFLTDSATKSDGFVAITPSLLTTSDWSRHQLSIDTGATLRRFFSQTLRDEDNWHVNGLGRLDIGRDFAVTAELQAAKAYESPFSGEVLSNVAVLSNYRRNTASLRGQYTDGRIRLTIVSDYNHYKFNDVDLTDGTSLNQSDRNRDVARVTGQAEYAFSPSVAVYGQFTYTNTDYDLSHLLNGAPNRDSNAVRALAGINVDIAGVLRGDLGIGYTRRDYRSGTYSDVGGFSAEARLEYFLSDLTTFTLSGRRILEDSNLGDNGAYFDNLVSLRADHELLPNLLLNATVTYDRQSYVHSPSASNIYEVSAGSKWMLSRAISLHFDTSYVGRSSRELLGTGKLHEVRGEVGFTIQR